MKKFWIQVMFLALLIFAATYFSFNPQGGLPGFSLSNQQPTSQKRLRINNLTITAEVADTPQLRARGLGGRDSLPQDFGMLFVFPEAGMYQFWMKGVRFPLDFIYINQGKVVDIIKNVPTVEEGTDDSQIVRYQAVVPADMVLEVNAGVADSGGIKVGDTVFEVR